MAKTELDKELARVKKIRLNRAMRRALYQKKEWYTIQSLLGNQLYLFYILLGSRERGKSYSVMKYVLGQWKEYETPFTWIRLNEASTKKMLANNAAQMVDPDLYDDYNLDLKVKGNTVLDNGKHMAHVLALSTAHNDKGVAFFDNNYTGNLNIVLDEFQLEKSQKRTFDLAYNLVVELENLVRSRKYGIKIFMIGNSTEEASDILSMFNFIPQEFGIYKLIKNKAKCMEMINEYKALNKKKNLSPKERAIAEKRIVQKYKKYDFGKRCIIDYMPNSQAYTDRRKGTVGDILAGSTSNFTNSIETDISMLWNKRLGKPSYIIKFSKSSEDWFTVFEDNVVAKYNKENKPGVAMKRYANEIYNTDLVTQIFAQWDARAFKFKNLLTQKQFAYQLSLIKK